MSVSKWAYSPEKCDGQPCVQDCDLCPKRDNLEAGIYSDNPDDHMKYVQTAQPVDLWGYPKNELDLVEVIRCKDCKHYRKSDARHPDCEWCKRLICGTVKPDFFCADGERREDGDNR